MSKSPTQGRRMLRYGTTKQPPKSSPAVDPTTIPREERTPGDAFIGLSGEELKKVWAQGQMFAALDLASREDPHFFKQPLFQKMQQK
jgi:hypothetical protein